MRKWLAIAGGGLMAASCGGGGSSGSDPVAVVPAPTPTAAPTAPATPTPTPSASPTAAPTPTPTVSAYTRFVDLTGARTFQTACASLLLNTDPPTPEPAKPFGDGLSLDLTASGGWTIGGDGVALSFASTDAVAASAGQRSYERTLAGSVQRFTITDPVAAGTTLDFARSFSLRTDRSSGATLYSCVFGVPTTTADRPTAAISYGKVGVNGTAYVADPNGTMRTYVLTASTGAVNYDPATNAVVVRVRLLGNLQTSSGIAAATTELGTFTGSAAVDAARGTFSGPLDSTDRLNLFATFGGWFFGGTETASAFEILAADANEGSRMSVVGTVYAAR